MLCGCCRGGGRWCCVNTLDCTTGTGCAFGIASGVCHTSTPSVVIVTISVIITVTMPYTSREC